MQIKKFNEQKDENSIFQKEFSKIKDLKNKLKPCPFCNSTHIEITGWNNGWRVVCYQCTAEVHEVSNYILGTCLKWNKRNGKVDLDLIHFHDEKFPEE